MNILLATSSAVPSGGGVASYNQELANLFHGLHNIYLITAANETDVEGYVKTISTYGKNWKSYEYAQTILQQIDDWEIDLAINSDSPLLAVLAPFIKIPIVSVSHFVDGKCALNAGYNSAFISRIVSLSYYGKDYLEQTFNISKKDKVEVVYNFVADEPLPKPTHKTQQSPLIIVYPGGTSIKKSVDVVMRTIYRLLKTDLDFKFIWLGQTILPSAKLSPHKYTTQFFPRDKRLIITDKVSREEAVHYIEQANIFLLPSRGEGCPMTLLEAMRAGCIPIVSDAKHGSREILEAGNFGIIVKQDDSKELYNAICDILCHHTKYQNEYFATQSFSRNNLSQIVWAQKMASVIDSALAESKKTIPFSEENYRKSLGEYERLQRKYCQKEHVDSLKCRLYLEYLYYFIK